MAHLTQLSVDQIRRPQIQNVVSTTYLGCKLDLKTIANGARNAEYNPKRFAACIMRVRKPKSTALVFSSGKMVVLGATNEQNSQLASRKYARIIQRLGFSEVRFKRFKISNIVANADVGFPVRLEGLAYDHNESCSYEPEMFAGLCYHMMEPKVSLIIFVSGKVVLTGARTFEDINTAFDAIYPTLQGFRKQKLY